MLSDHPVYATIPTQDVAALRRFYEDVLRRDRRVDRMTREHSPLLVDRNNSRTIRRS